MLVAAFAEPKVTTLARRADAEVFGPTDPTPADVEEFWRQVDEIVGGMSTRTLAVGTHHRAPQPAVAPRRHALRAARAHRPPRRTSPAAPRRSAAPASSAVRPASSPRRTNDRPPPCRRRPGDDRPPRRPPTRSTSPSRTASSPCSSASPPRSSSESAAGSDPTSLALMLRGRSWAVIALVALAWALVYTAMQGGRGSIGQRTLRLRLYDARPGPRSASAAPCCATSCGLSPPRSSSATSRRCSTRPASARAGTTRPRARSSATARRPRRRPSHRRPHRRPPRSRRLPRPGRRAAGRPAPAAAHHERPVVDRPRARAAAARRPA